MRSRLFTRACGAGLALAACAQAALAEIPDIPHEFYTLDNGLEVILHEDHSTPIVSVNIWYHVGSKNERPGRSGFAHLFEHMMFQGSEHHDGEFISLVQGVGGTLNGSTSEDRTNYWEIVPRQHLETALILEADRMGFLLPAMTQEKFENQQDVVRNERREGEGEPYSSFELNLNENFYPKGHPYDHSVIGIHEDLEAASLEDVKDFFRTYYTPNNATLCIAGDFEPAKAREWVKKYFGVIPPGPPIEEVSVWVPEMTGEKRMRAQDDVQLARVYYAWHSPPFYHEGDADMDFAAKVLAGGRSSRLYRRLVHEEKLAQDVDASQYSQQVSSVFLVTITLRPGADPKAAERILDEEIARLSSEGPTAEELGRAKAVFEAAFVKGIQNVGSWGGKSDRLNRYNHYLGTPDGFRRDYERFMSRTPDTVRKQLARCTGRGRLVYEIQPMGKLKSADPGSVDLAVIPEGGGIPELSAPAVQRATLPSGLRLVVMEHHELPLVRLNLVFHSGTASDPVGREGLADLTADMLLEGTQGRDKFEFEDALDALGTDLRIWAADDYTSVFALSLTKTLEKSMRLIAEAILQPAFPKTELADKKERRLNDIKRQQDSPHTISFKATQLVGFGEGHPYSRWGSGSEASVSAITLDDVKSHAAAHFTPGNATLLAVGDITLAELRGIVERRFGKWSGPAPPALEISEPRPQSGRTLYLIDKPGDTQSTISLVHPGMRRSDPAWPELFVANRVLGDFFSSRLNLNLREDKGYTYGARALTWENRGPSLFSMFARVQREVTAESLVEFLKELEDITGRRPISAEELAFAKDSILLGYPREFETISQLAGALREQVVYGLPDDNFASYPRRIDAVDLEAANARAASFFDPENVAVLVVGDLAEIEASVRALDIGPVRYLDRNGKAIQGEELSSR